MAWDSLPEELVRLADQLHRDSETTATAEDLRTLASRFRASWKQGRELRADGDGIRIPPPRKQGLQPPSCEVSDAYISFVFKVDEHAPVHMPLRSDFQVRVSGLLEVGETIVLVEDHWRSDTDIEYANSAPSREPHPQFHFQRGGHAQDAFMGDDGFVPGSTLGGLGLAGLRALFQTPGPRIAMVPMCPVLMIDFAVSQNNGVTWRRLRRSLEYSSLISHAQRRLLIPFLAELQSETFARRWLGGMLI